MDNPLKPSIKLLCKLGSIITHSQEAMGDNAHEFDVIAIKSLLEDDEIKQWLSQMDELALIPKKRK